MILHAPEHRYREQTLWRYPVLMDGERFMYENEDRRVREGLPCAECGETLGYPIVFWMRMEDDLYMHPRCARHLKKCRLSTKDIAISMEVSERTVQRWLR